MSLDERGLTRGELLYQQYKDNIIKVLQTGLAKNYMIYSELQTKIHSTMSNVIKISRNKLKIKITGYVTIIYTLKD
jgi:hypothetical protein